MDFLIIVFIIRISFLAFSAIRNIKEKLLNKKKSLYLYLIPINLNDLIWIETKKITTYNYVGITMKSII